MLTVASLLLAAVVTGPAAGAPHAGEAPAALTTRDPFSGPATTARPGPAPQADLRDPFAARPAAIAAAAVAPSGPTGRPSDALLHDPFAGAAPTPKPKSRAKPPSDPFVPGPRRKAAPAAGDGAPSTTLRDPFAA